MEDSNKLKQKYLFEQIIEKNYDPEEFQEYLAGSNPLGDDLQNWTMSQLRDSVSQFQKNHQPSVRDLDEKKQIPDRTSYMDEYAEMEIERSTTMRSVTKMTQNPMHFDYQSSQETFRKVLECQPLQLTELAKAQKLQVKVIKFEKKEGGLFEQSYVCYFVRSSLFNCTVERRYSDFQWLKERIQWLHPGVPVPPIAKKGQFRRYDDKHLRKRMMILQMFLNKLMVIPQLKAQPVLESFLQLGDKVAWEKFKSNHGKINSILPIKNIQCGNGVKDVELDPINNAFTDGAQNFFTDIQPCVKSLYKDFKGVATALEECGAILQGVSRKCDRLDDAEKSFRKNHQINYLGNNFYTILSESVSRLANQLINQAQIFRTETYSMLKYESYYMLNLIQHLESLKQTNQKYFDSKASLAKKKLKLYEENNQQKWELDIKVDHKNKQAALDAMLPKQTRKLAKMRDVYALYSTEMVGELRRYFETKNGELGGYFMQWCRNQTRVCSEMMMLWVDAETNLLGVKQNKMVMKC